MCNINILFRKKMNNKVTPFLMAASSHSFASNDDGEGIYFNSTDKVFKAENKMNYFAFEKDIESSNVIITHQRLSTSGFEIKFNHPFANDDFILVHNGVINQFKKDKGSDTYGLWLRFNEEFNKIKSHLSREDKVKKIISDLFKKDLGSYSILIYDKKTKNSYYFKGEGYPQINFYDNDEYLFITTNSDNAIFLPMLTAQKFKELEIKGRKIYKISKEFVTYKSIDLPKSKEEEEEIEESFYVSKHQQSFNLGEEENETQTTLASKPKAKHGECANCLEALGNISYKLCNENICYDCWRIINGFGGKK